MKGSLHWLLSLVIVSWVLVAYADAGDSEDAAAAEQNLAEVRKRIQKLEKEARRALKSRGTAEQALQKAEIAESGVRSKLRGVDQDIGRARTRLAELEGQARESERELNRHRSELERQLRLAYVAGQEDWLRAVLSQRDPVAIGRQVVYYSYFARQRSRLLETVRSRLLELEETTDAANREQARLEEILAARQARLQELSSARKNRRLALARLDENIRSRSDEIGRLRVEAEEFEFLVAELTRLLTNLPITDSTPFRESKGRLAWPADGRVIRKFGQSKADGRMQWQGALLGASAGSEVHAVHHGRVVFSDWLPGMGLLVVLEHGDGYLSLYGHNQDLVTEVGDWVAPGAVIAHVGDSGGQASPGLYFEIRKDGLPVDPGDWVQR